MAEQVKKKIVRARPKSVPLSLSMSRNDSSSIYEKDFYKWVMTQANFLKQKEYSKLDIDNLIEEIESLGRSERRALESHFKRLLMHLLKIKYQPSHHSPSWDTSVRLAKMEIRELLDDNPSLKPKVAKVFDRAYQSARLSAALETGLDEKTFPKKCPWTQKECLDD